MDASKGSRTASYVGPFSMLLQYWSHSSTHFFLALGWRRMKNTERKEREKDVRKKRVRVTKKDYLLTQSSLSRALLSKARPIVLRPLSTYKQLPVMAEERGEHKKAATLATSSAPSSFCMGALAHE